VTSLIPRTTARLLLPLLLLFSVFLLLRGHNEPGGGFAGGLVAAAAFCLYGMATDAAQARRVLRGDPRNLIGMGLLVALASGLIPVLGGAAFLTGTWVAVPLLGGAPLEIGTPLLFDIGVYLAVVGVTLTIVLSLSHEEG
jgi:multicomponent Na+:H+ antiporter subunit B